MKVVGTRGFYKKAVEVGRSETSYLRYSCTYTQTIHVKNQGKQAVK
jgi:hypothetical protein